MSIDVHAIEDPPDFTYGGFVSTSWIKSTNGVEVTDHSASTVGSFDRIETGIYGNYAVDPYLDVRSMVTMFKEGSYSEASPIVNYALVDLHDKDQDVGMRVGRVSHAAGFYSDIANVPSYKDTELYLVGSYKEGLRDLSKNGDGIQVYGALPTVDNWHLDLEFTAAQPDLRDQAFLNSTFFLLPSGSFTEARFYDKSIKLSNLEEGWAMRFDRNDLALTFLSEDPTQPSGHYNRTVDRLSVRKYFDSSDLIVEYVRADHHSCAVLCFKINPVAYDASYRIYDEEFTYTLGYGVYAAANSDYEISPNPAGFYTKDFTVGAKYTHNEWSFLGEVHRVLGTNPVLAEENNIVQSDHTSYNVVMFTVIFSF